MWNRRARRGRGLFSVPLRDRLRTGLVERDYRSQAKGAAANVSEHEILTHRESV